MSAREHRFRPLPIGVILGVSGYVAVATLSGCGSRANDRASVALLDAGDASLSRDARDAAIDRTEGDSATPREADARAASVDGSRCPSVTDGGVAFDAEAGPCGSRPPPSGSCGGVAGEGEYSSGFTLNAELLADPSFESFGSDGQATSWEDNSYACAGCGTPPVIEYAPSTTIVHSGTYSQQIDCVALNGGTCLFKQPLGLQEGHAYEGSLWARAAAGGPDGGAVTMTLLLRDDDGTDYYKTFASRTVTLGPTWQNISIEGQVDTNVNGAFVVIAQTEGTFYIDDAYLAEVTPYVVPFAAISQNVPSKFFGTHFLCKECYGDYWPSVPLGMMRLWDSGTDWSAIETSRGEYGWGTTSELDYYIGEATAHDVDVIYTFGYTPSWAGPASSGPPTDEQDWKDFVNALTLRNASVYDHKIKYYELWNESDSSTFWTGTPAALIQMARDAATIIRANDPGALIIWPNITPLGIGWGDALLAGGLYDNPGSTKPTFDVMSMHVYPLLSPETNASNLFSMRALMSSYGLGALPLFNTEGAVRDPSGATLTQNEPSTQLDDQGRTARGYLTNWTAGVDNFNWYTWDYGSRSDFGATNPAVLSWLWLATNDDAGSPTVLTYAGKALQTVSGWMLGATLVGSSIGNQGTWEIDLTLANGTPAHILWNTTGQGTYTVTCSASQVTALDGTVTKLSGNTIVLTQSPVLLE